MTHFHLKVSKFFIVFLAIIAGCVATSATHAQVISTVAGNGTWGYGGDGGAATAAAIHSAYNITPDAAGNLYIADYANYRIRKVNPAGIITTIAGTGTLGYSGDGGPATAAQLNCPACVAIDAAGNLYVADMMNSVIRKINSAGIISTVVGTGSRGNSGDGGQATAAQICFVYNIVVDASGNLYLADEASSVVRKVNTSGIITTIAGNGTNGYSGDGGQATAAAMSEPWSVALDHAGNLFILDLNKSVVRKVTPSGIISTVAGTGTAGYSGDGGAATAAMISGPTCVTTDATGNLYIADYDNSRIRKVTTSGIISTVAGTGARGFAGDGGPATAAEINFPTGIALDHSGNLYISDLINQRIRKVLPSSTEVQPVSTNGDMIRIFPNPANGTFFVDLPLPASAAIISITDLAGRVVEVVTTQKQLVAIDAACYNAGIYVVSVSMDGKTFAEKMVISK